MDYSLPVCNPKNNPVPKFKRDVDQLGVYKLFARNTPIAVEASEVFERSVKKYSKSKGYDKDKYIAYLKREGKYDE